MNILGRPAYFGRANRLVLPRCVKLDIDLFFAVSISHKAIEARRTVVVIQTFNGQPGDGP
jgi:hypothetical protein